ncbi:MAG: ATP-dependent DNA helicase RecG [Evtepia sp.]
MQGERTMTGEEELQTLAGIGSAKSAALARLGLHQLDELLRYFPRDYEDRNFKPSIAAAEQDMPICIAATVTEAFRSSVTRSGTELVKGKIADASAQISVVFFHSPYVKAHLRLGGAYAFYGRLSNGQLINPEFEPFGENQISGGILPIYPLTAGISNRFLMHLTRQALDCDATKIEILPPSVLQKYELAQIEFSYRSIHFPPSEEALGRARRRLMFEEVFCLMLGLSLLRTRRSTEGAIAFEKRDLSSFFKTLPFSLTTGQARSVAESAADLGRTIPMNRLLQGDVGAGKTVVAAACAWLAWQNGCQSALMAPTELLANQHLQTMNTLLQQTGMHIGLLTGSMTATEKRNLRTALAAGEIDLLIGTHALLTEEVTFSRLALVITDEQHRFGVSQRAALSAKAGSTLRPHVLVMSATPIPRTLALLIYGDLEVSVIDTLPPGRTPVETFVVGEDKRIRLYGFIRKKVKEGRQVYLVCPAVEDSLGMKAAAAYGKELQTKIFPDLRTEVLHGKMKPKDKERIMAAFVGGEIDILVATTVIEVGVDVPNAALMVIENADRFGLSQLHQLRGRVGRGTYASTCVLVTSNRNPQTMERLRALASTTDGFKIAEEDLRLRGPGDFFGERQHGLPPLKLTNLAVDLRILHEAQTAARDLLAVDPELRESPALRERILRLFDGNAAMFQ